MARSKIKKAKSKTKPKRKSKIARIVEQVVRDLKKKAKTSAKSSATRKRGQREVTAEQLAPLALAGDVDGIDKLLDDGAYAEAYGDYDLASLFYKWLLVAADFAKTARKREAAEDASNNLWHNSALHHDDNYFAAAEAHWEIGIAYLKATEGLPRNLERARRELAQAKLQKWPYAMSDAREVLAAARKDLDPEALAVFDRVYKRRGTRSRR
jgi:hypothetical protein